MFNHWVDAFDFTSFLAFVRVGYDIVVFFIFSLPRACASPLRVPQGGYDPTMDTGVTLSTYGRVG